METFIARQPILTRHQEVYGYELLFRSGPQNLYTASDGDQATSRVVMDSQALFDIQTMTSGKRAFINFTQDLLLGGYATLLPKELVVVEILETVEPTEDILSACKGLKEAGYLLALDDFVYEDRFEPLLDLADIIKVDLIISDERQRERIVARARQSGIKLLAEKVESQAEFEAALEAGYDYFQGFFFSHPAIISGQDINPAKHAYFQILKEINQPELNFDHLAQIVTRDVGLTYKLLRYINSAYFGFRTEIRSINQVLALLGEANIKKWLSLVTMASLGEEKPHELLTVAMVRAFFCELLHPKIKSQTGPTDRFLLGLFSTIDAFLDRPMTELMGELPIAAEVKDALIGQPGQLHSLLDTAVAYERGDWASLSQAAHDLANPEKNIPALYLKAVESAQ